MPLYPRYEQAAINQNANTNLMTGTVKLVLVNSSLYTYSDTHEFLNDIASGARVGISAALTAKTNTNGTFSSAQINFTNLNAIQANAVIMFIDTGTESTSRLVSYQASVTGLPITPVAGDSAIMSISNYLFSRT